MVRTPSSDDQLRRYRAKRDFARTPEPAGDLATAESRPGALRYVVQRHRARALHYDFRLEMDGVLASWAVPKGPTLDPKVRRAAFHVEDHPLEYVDFEGIIPSGQYGGGDVIVWDAGTWEPVRESDAADPARAVADGEVHMALDGEKLHGRFVLVRTRTDSSGKEEWLLLHKNDEFAVSGWNAEDWPRSVLSDRTNDEVKADPDRLWRSDLPAARASVLLKPTPVGAQELAQLDALGESGVWSVHGRDLPVTRLDTVMFAKRARERAVTKRDLLRYTAHGATVFHGPRSDGAPLCERSPVEGFLATCGADECSRVAAPMDRPLVRSRQARCGRASRAALGGGIRRYRVAGVTRPH
jgi:bifunctional non-homologous end joining protein LigD